MASNKTVKMVNKDRELAGRVSCSAPAAGSVFVPPFRYCEELQSIFDGNDNKVAEMEAWDYLISSKLDGDQAEDVRTAKLDEFGKWVVRAMNADYSPNK